MPANIIVNEFEVSIREGGYPFWVTIKRGTVEFPVLIHHKELKDLEYALSRAREQIRAKLQDGDKWEA